LVRNFRAQLDYPVVQVNAVDGNDYEDLLFQIASELDSVGMSAMGEQPGQDLKKGLHAALRDTCLIVIEDFQESLSKETSLPDQNLLSLLQQVSRKPLPGRVLAVTNVALADGPWRDDISVINVHAPAESEAIEILMRALDAQDCPDAVPEAIRGDVVRWLGYNPRAIEILSVCLSVDSIRDLIDLEPDAWNNRNQAVSQKLIRRLENRFMGRTLGRLDSNTRLLLDLLSVYRIPFSKDVFVKIAPKLASEESARDRLSTSFLLSFHRGWFEVNKIAQHICRRQLEASPRILQTAHNVAADHYIRHFKARSLEDPFKHGKEFIEARYHLIISDRESEFADVASRCRSRLRAMYRSPIIVPEDPIQLNERILVLAAALSDQEDSWPVLRESLARLCVKRQRSGDEIVALNQLRIALREAKAARPWVLYMRLLAATEGLSAVTRTVKTIRPESLPPGELTTIYITAAKILNAEGLHAEASELAEEGLTFIPPDSAWNLTIFASFVLRQQGEHGRAGNLVESHMDRMGPSNPNFYRLLETCVLGALALGEADRLSRLDSKYRSFPEAQSYVDLIGIISDQLESNYEVATRRTLKGDGSFHTVHLQRAFCYLVLGDPRLAAETFLTVQRKVSAAYSWLEYLIAMALGRSDLSVTALSACLGRSATDGELADPNLWLKIWDQIPANPSPYPAFYYPRLPSRLTGMKTDLVRYVGQPSPINEFMLGLVRVPLLASATVVESERDSGASEVFDGEKMPAGVTVINQVSPRFGAIYSGHMEGNVSDVYNVNQAGAVGRDSRAENPVFYQGTSPIPLTDLARELETLKAALESRAATDEERRAVAATAAAAKAAIEGDGAKTARHLAVAGRWALAAANAIGAGLAVAAIKQVLGI
jgi:hypothetical protein